MDRQKPSQIELSEDERQIYERLGPLFEQERRCVITGDIPAAQADVEHVDDRQWLLPELSRRCQLVMQCAGVVDQNVEPSLITSHSLKQRANLLILAVVYANGDPFTARRSNRLRSFVNRTG